MLISVALGQVLSLLICGIGLTSKYLSEDFHANTPVFQSFLNYILLFLVYTTTLAVRQGEENLLAILRRRWWKYLILGLIDLEANYLVVKAYQYTTLTSVQLLDCFVIPVVILLSWFFLLVRYKAVHFLGIVVCILGMGCMVGADVLVGRHQGAGENKLVGDLLVLGGATLYGISNVWEEYIVRTLSRVEFLGMIGLFGAFFSGIQLAIMEHKELLKVPWDWQIALCPSSSRRPAPPPSTSPCSRRTCTACSAGCSCSTTSFQGSTCCPSSPPSSGWCCTPPPPPTRPKIPACTSSSATLRGLSWTCPLRPRWSPRSPTPAWARRPKRSPACAWPRPACVHRHPRLVHRERYLLGAAHAGGLRGSNPGSLERRMRRTARAQAWCTAWSHSAVRTLSHPHVISCDNVLIKICVLLVMSCKVAVTPIPRRIFRPPDRTMARAHTSTEAHCTATGHL
ncbi:solute carrier family 35 member F1 isoform X1 [Octodon degus]|uniref:Solute carrier family 35 member F1 isoform X1 n=1 Tax=Octodon degus TaxID=10160 RepID=A0A6P6ECJ5_OCTDE|nr:solute carrier family 35 member F1 isoform X1 [Octodon degus]